MLKREFRFNSCNRESVDNFDALFDTEYKGEKSIRNQNNRCILQKEIYFASTHENI